MIRLTNAQISAFNNPIIAKLLGSDDRRFPTADAFRLADIVSQIQPKTELFRTQAKKIIKDAGGDIDADGTVKYASPEVRFKVEVELKKLNDVEVEITGDLLTTTDDWPTLSVHEAMILKPLLNVNGVEKK